MARRGSVNNREGGTPGLIWCDASRSERRSNRVQPYIVSK